MSKQNDMLVELTKAIEKIKEKYELTNEKVSKALEIVKENWAY